MCYGEADESSGQKNKRGPKPIKQAGPKPEKQGLANAEHVEVPYNEGRPKAAPPVCQAAEGGLTRVSGGRRPPNHVWTIEHVHQHDPTF